MARHNAEELSLAEQALANALPDGTKVDRRRYCERAEDNLIGTVGPGIWRRVQQQLESGKGTELAAKFRAPYSSSALAVNAFAPLLDCIDLPEGRPFCGNVRFEQERSAWAPRYWPTLDVIVEDPRAPVRLYIESKCIEFLRVGHPEFSHAFVEHGETPLRNGGEDIQAAVRRPIRVRSGRRAAASQALPRGAQGRRHGYGTMQDCAGLHRLGACRR
jgi:hypothetical protein